MEGSISQIYKDSQDRKYEIFNEWIQKEGVIIPKLEYPATFDHGLTGVRVKEEIQHREAFLFVPFKILITMETAFNDPDIGHIFKEHPKIFTKEHDDFEQMTLSLFMLHEFQKGKESYWFPYLNLLPDVEFFCNWPGEDLKATEDENLVQEAINYKRDIELEWKELELVMLSYPQHFKLEIIDRHLFMRIFAQVCSRCFGWGLPTTAMIPMADNLNHSHISVINETIHLDLQTKVDKSSKYFTKDKFMNDYSQLYTEEQINQYKQNVTGYFNRDKFNENVKKYSLENWKEEIKEKDLWEVSYREEDCDEDNDTSEEEDDDEEFDAEYETKTKSEKFGSDLLNPKKGFKFFIEQEQKFLQGLEKRNKQQIQKLKEEQNKPEENKQDQLPKIIDLSVEGKDEKKENGGEVDKKNGNIELNESGEIDYDYEDEDFSWYTETIRDKTYFVLVNCDRKPFKKGDQAFYCYGKRSNAFLLLNYGFCIPDNRYDSYSFRVKLNVHINHEIQEYSDFFPDLSSSDEDYYCSEEIRLKFDQLNLVLIGYLRTIFKNYYLRNSPHDKDVNILLTKPKDIDYEIFIFNHYLGIMKYVLAYKERNTTLEKDLIILEEPDLNYRKWFAVQYRSEKKKIIRTNIDLAQYVLRILNELKQRETLTSQEFKALYLEQTDLERDGLLKRWVVDQSYNDEENFYRRRLNLGQYLKDLAELKGITNTYSIE